jgi:hypothetical protein
MTNNNQWEFKIGFLRSLVIQVGLMLGYFRKLNKLAGATIKASIGIVFILVIMLQAVTSDDSVELIKKSFQENESIEFIAYISVIIFISLVFIYIEKTLKFDSTFNTYKKVDAAIKAIDSRIEDATNHLSDKNKMNKLMNDIGGLSISKRMVYEIERKSKKTVVLSKELNADIQDEQLHNIILTKFRIGVEPEFRPEEIEYTWYSDKQTLTDAMGTLMDTWFEFMIQDPDYHLSDVWKSTKYKIIFKKIIDKNHLLIHDINIYNRETKDTSEVVGFIDENLLTHFVRLNIEPDNLLNALEEHKESVIDMASRGKDWERFVKKKISQMNVGDLWRMV